MPGCCPYLLGLLQQLHALPQDLAVELPALPQDLPAHLLHGGLQGLPLALAQRLAGPAPRLLLQRVVQCGLELLDFLGGPNHTDRRRSQRVDSSGQALPLGQAVKGLGQGGEACRGSAEQPAASGG